MSFGYLPWPVYLLLVMTIAIVLFQYSVRNSKNEPKTLIFGLILLGIVAILAGFHKLSENIVYFEAYQYIFKNLAIIIGFLGIFFLLIGGYIRVKTDPYRRKIVLSSIFALSILSVLGVLSYFNN